MKRTILSFVVTLHLAASVFPQSRRQYDGFYLELDKRGRVVALVFREGNVVGCSPVASEIATITDVEWNIVVTGFTARFRSGKKTFLVPDSINGLANAERGLVSDIFRKGKRVRITWRECGSGNIADLISVRLLR